MNRATRQIEKYLIDSGADPAKISAASSLLTWYWKKSRFFIAMPRCVIVTWQNKIWFNKDKKRGSKKAKRWGIILSDRRWRHWYGRRGSRMRWISLANTSSTWIVPFALFHLVILLYTFLWMMHSGLHQAWKKWNSFLLILRRIKLMRFYARFSSLACFLS